MPIRISDEELEALARGESSSKLSHEAKLTYLLAIRPYMDYGTRIAGRHRRISYQSIREAIEFFPAPGSRRKEKRYNTESIRAILKELERAGLIEWVRTKERGLVFRCLLADWDSAAENRNNIRTTSEQHQRNNTNSNTRTTPENLDESINCSNKAASNNTSSNIRTTSEQHQRNNIPPVSGINKNPPTGDLYIGQSTEQNTRKSATRFDEFWAAYPKKVAKKACRDKWRAKGLDRMADRIIDDVRRRCREHRPWLEGYIPNPLTYLNQERWEDEFDTRGKTKKPQATVTAIDDFLYGRQVGPPQGGRVIDGQAKTINSEGEDDDDYHHDGRHARKEAQIR